MWCANVSACRGVWPTHFHKVSLRSNNRESAVSGAYTVLCSMIKGTYVSRQCEVKYRQVTRANVLIEKEQMCVGVIAVAHASVC